MFIYYFVHLDLPFPEAERRLVGVVSGLDGMAVAAYREGEELRARIGLGEPPLIAKTVRLEVGQPVAQGGTTVLPIVWEATGTPGLFPRMEADLVVAALGPGLTQLALRGSYSTPLGLIGRALDRALLHRVAEASVKGFVDRIARALQVHQENTFI
jgi:hypothetical protein